MNSAQKCVVILKITIPVAFLVTHSYAQLKEWKIPCDAVYKPENCENASIDNLETIPDYERCAPALLDILSRNYAWGAAGQGKTFFENKEAYNRMWIKKQVLKDVYKSSLQTTVFGRKIGIPIGISPTAGQCVYNKEEGERGAAKAAASVGAVYILSVYANTSLEDVAAAVPKDTELWMHTSMFPKRDLVVDVVRRAEKAGYKAIVLTVDQPTDFSVRCNSYSKFFEKHKHSVPNVGPHQLKDIGFYGVVTAADVKWLAGMTHLPLVVKGVQSGDDALQAIKAGASGIFVSNQGGRQLDDALPTIDSLLDVVKAVRSRYPKVEVFIDGGIRSGHDVYKALARGAKMAFIGRPAIWGLTMAGEKGVNKVLSILRDELQDAMIRAGFSSPSLISPQSIVSDWKYSDYRQMEL